MGKNNNFVMTALQWVLFLTINTFFACKYGVRAGLNPALCAAVYGIIIAGLVFLYRKKIAHWLSKRAACILSIAGLVAILTIIALAIIFISPLSIRVDRWSATAYFLDALFSGEYPYSVHTHVCETNYPSPFPLWHYLHIPFWLIGDVGWQQAFFLLMFVGAIYYYFRSWHSVLAGILLLCLSPAYWWEVMTRSDGLSNALMAASCILFVERKPIRMKDQWWILALIAGCVASTRLSAVIPLALYLFKPWLEAEWKAKVGFAAIAAGVVIFFFLPYIFWDTENWIFFQRNPFITQAILGNRWVLLLMVCLAIVIAYKKQTFYYFASTTSAFMFVFMLLSQLSALIGSNGVASTLGDIYFDVSYLTLAMPYVIISLLLTPRTTLTP